MKYWLKIILQRLLNILPHKYAIKSNQFIVDKISGRLSEKISVEARFRKGIENCRLLVNKTSFSFKDSNILELGTGWHGIDLIVFYLLGSNQIFTVDHYTHLDFKEFKMICKKICKLDIEGIFSEYGLTIITSRFKKLKKILNSTDSLQNLFNELSVHYVIAAPKNYSKIKYLKKIDLFYSESVLQRIDKLFLIELLESVSKEMSENSVFFHRTDQCDVNAQKHIVKSQNRLSYLRYSKTFFQLINSSKLNNQNRLREFEFIEIFKENNLDVVYLLSRYSNEDYRYVSSSETIKSKYLNFSSEDIAVSHSKFIGRFSKRISLNEINSYDRELEVSSKTDNVHLKK